MTTMKNVLTAANEQVARLMREGYMISFGDSSFGCTFRVDLENGESFIRVEVKEKHGFGKADSFVLRVVEIGEADGFERDDAVVRFTKTWYVIERLHDARRGRWLNDYILTDCEEESDAITEKRHERWTACHIANTNSELIPSAALIRSLKSRKGFSNATRTTISVVRVNSGYEISLKARDGHVSRKETIRFPKH